MFLVYTASYFWFISHSKATIYNIKNNTQTDVYQRLNRVLLYDSGICGLYYFNLW